MKLLIQINSISHTAPPNYTNERLFKMSIKLSNLCGFCNNHVDSIEHMLLECEVSQELCGSVNNWIIELGMENLHLSYEKIIMRDLENALAINSIILVTKTIIYNTIKK